MVVCLLVLLPYITIPSCLVWFLSPPLQCNYFVFARPSSFLVFLCLLKCFSVFKTQFRYQQLLLSFPWKPPSVVFFTSLSVILTMLKFLNLLVQRLCLSHWEQRYLFLFTAVFLVLSTAFVIEYMVHKYWLNDQFCVSSILSMPLFLGGVDFWISICLFFSLKNCFLVLFF